jgi:cytochrome c
MKEKRGELPKGTCKHWADVTPDIDNLPEKVAMLKYAKKLTARGREQVKDSNFVFPEQKKYPIHDMNHARAALSMVAAHGTPEEQAAVRAKVYEKYPSLRPDNEKTAELMDRIAYARQQNIR